MATIREKTSGNEVSSREEAQKGKIDETQRRAIFPTISGLSLTSGADTDFNVAFGQYFKMFDVT